MCQSVGSCDFLLLHISVVFSYFYFADFLFCLFSLSVYRHVWRINISINSVFAEMAKDWTNLMVTFQDTIRVLVWPKCEVRRNKSKTERTGDKMQDTEEKGLASA